MSNVNDIFCVHMLISGRVQGVAFRYHARKLAKELGIRGWIKNLANGQVELIIEGSKSSVQKMIEWCKQGPDRAIVEDIVLDWLSCIENYPYFQIID